uniref:Sulfotransferase n=1 Tax=Kalanchoe fedtschenkoi TaxID=63787 RepID=A0A7N0TD67_KALFE
MQNLIPLIIMGLPETQQHQLGDVDSQAESVDPETAKLSCPATAAFIRSLPKERGWRTPFLYKYQNFWCQPREIQAIINLQTHFKAHRSDIIIATIPKSGTTWLKALLYATLNRGRYEIRGGGGFQSHPLLFSNSHDLVPFLEYKLYANGQIPDLGVFDSPRIFATHVPYPALPGSVKTSGAKVVYLCRNPLDTFISSWHFIKNVRHDSLGDFTMDRAFDMFCRGVVGFGPFWEHMLGYWKQSIANPNRVLFLKYEDMKDDVVPVIEKLAEFLGMGFSPEEEAAGVAAEIANLCSFETQKELEVNKTGKSISGFENWSLFRKGEVGDWVNHLSPEMGDKMRQVVVEKLAGSGLTFSGF